MVDVDADEVIVTAGADTGMGSIVEPAYGVPVGVTPQLTSPAGVGGMELRPPEITVAFLTPVGCSSCINIMDCVGSALGVSAIDIMDCVDMNASSIGLALRGLDVFSFTSEDSDNTSGAGEAPDPAACASDSFMEKPAEY